MSTHFFFKMRAFTVWLPKSSARRAFPHCAFARNAKLSAASRLLRQGASTPIRDVRPTAGILKILRLPKRRSEISLHLCAYESSAVSKRDCKRPAAAVAGCNGKFSQKGVSRAVGKTLQIRFKLLQFRRKKNCPPAKYPFNFPANMNSLLY